MWTQVSFVGVPWEKEEMDGGLGKGIADEDDIVVMSDNLGRGEVCGLENVRKQTATNVVEMRFGCVLGMMGSIARRRFGLLGLGSHEC